MRPLCGSLVATASTVAALTRASIALAAAPDGQAAGADPKASESAPQKGRAENRGDLDLLTIHRLTYFTTGFSAASQVKFQFSVKYDLWPNRTNHGVYFAYTQKSLWDLWDFDDSSPFTENNYRPEAFYAYLPDEHGRLSNACRYTALRAGIEHESNGERAERSRGWNRLYAEEEFTCGSLSDGFISWMIRIWLPFGLGDNPDISRFVGYGQAGLGASTPTAGYGRFELRVTGTKGTDTRAGALFAGKWLPSYDPEGFWRLTPYAYAQVFSGYGETLLGYDENRFRFRVGVGFSD